MIFSSPNSRCQMQGKRVSEKWCHLSKFRGSLGEDKTCYASDIKIVRGWALKAVVRETDVALISGKKNCTVGEYLGQVWECLPFYEIRKCKIIRFL